MASTSAFTGYPDHNFRFFNYPLHQLTILISFDLLGMCVCVQAILVGKVGQTPLQKKLKSGTVVTLLSLGTGGIRNNRRPLDNESPRDYANRCAVQWHRVTIYPERLGTLVMKHATPGWDSLPYSQFSAAISICKCFCILIVMFFFFVCVGCCRSTLYVEGNLESKVFSDPTTGLVRRIREVSVRRNGNPPCYFFDIVKIQV